MRKNNFPGYFLILLIFTVCVYTSSYSQGGRKIELKAQSILARVDRILQYPMGRIRGRIKHIKPTGKSYAVNITGYIARDNYLFIFNKRDRGDILKVLYNLGGEDIWVYEIQSIKRYHKTGIDKYDPVVFTNFYYIDLSNADLQSNYTASIVGNAFIQQHDAIKLILKPIFRTGGYGQLTLYVSKDKLIPLRIDYHDRDNVIFKFLTISKIREQGNKIIPVRYDMMDIRTGTMSILRFFSFDQDIKFDKEIFRPERLGE